MALAPVADEISSRVADEIWGHAGSIESMNKSFMKRSSRPSHQSLTDHTNVENKAWVHQE